LLPCFGCAQVSNAQVGKLARLAAGRPADTTSSSNGNGNGNGGGSSGPELVMDDFRHTADAAYAAVDVPDSVIDILSELRCYLQVGRGLLAPVVCVRVVTGWWSLTAAWLHAGSLNTCRARLAGFNRACEAHAEDQSWSTL
jgi:hypothetical protein